MLKRQLMVMFDFLANMAVAAWAQFAALVAGIYVGWRTAKTEIAANRAAAQKQRETDLEMAKIKHTLEFIQDYNSNLRVDRAHAFLRKIKGASSADQIKAFSDPKNRVAFLFLMNKFEILAIGLRRGIYDQKLVDDIFGHDIFKIYSDSKTLIKHIRETEEDGTALLNYEKLADKAKFEAQKIA